MKEILLSIIIPIYNLEKYISYCIDSIVSQVNKNVEIILIDDGSKDKSREICNKYCQKYNYIKYFYQENAGVSVARNNGLKKAIGEYILFVDGDDWIIENSIPEIIDKIKKNKEIDIITGDFVKSKNNKIEKKKRKKEKKLINLIKYDYPQNLIKLFKTNNFNPSLCCNVIKRKCFFDNNIFLDKNVKYTEDMDCTIQLFLKAKKIDSIEKSFYVYRQNQMSATHSYNLKRVDDTMDFVTKWLKDIKEIKSDELEKYLFNFVQYQYAIVVGLLYTLKRDERKKIMPKIKEKEYLLNNGLGKKGKIIHYIYNIFGFQIIGMLMATFIKAKSKIVI